MSEKRQSCMVWMLRFRGKSHKIELFQARLWKPGFFTNLRRGVFATEELRCRYRLRINGKWFNGDNGPIAYTRTEFRDALFRSLRPSFEKLEREARNEK